jgi:hypothetical protein
LKDKLKWLAPIVLVAIVLFGARTCVKSLEPVKVDPTTYTPLKVLQLELTPNPLVIGQPATLLDGICNTTDQPVNIQLYLGAQTDGTSTFNTMTVDLLTQRTPNGPVIVKDTPESRIRLALQPGCTATEPITALPPAGLTTNQVWRLKAHVIANGPNGETQDIVVVSDPFEVVEP